MKQLKRSLKFLPAMFAFVAFTACDKDDPVEIPEPEPAVAGIESFGFYQENNPDELIADYVVESISGTTIDVPLPAEVNVENLVASFTTTDGDEVTVQGVTQVSGETSNDFSAPLEYLVSEEETNVIYTVSVSKMAAAVWSELPYFDADLVKYPSLDINPENNMPYIAFISEREENDDEKLNLIGFNGSTWDYVGSEDFSPARARSVDLGFNQDGVPFVSFGDDSGDQTEAAVMSYQDGNWGYLGGGPFSGVRSSVNAVSVDQDNNVFGFYINDQIGDDNRRGVELKTFNGAWNDMPITGREGYSRAIRTKEVNGDIYLAVLDYGGGQAVSVYKYSDGVWSTLADKMKESEDSAIYFYDISMDVDRDGNVYVSYVETTADTPWQHKVRKYSAADNSWSNVGDIVYTSESSISIRSFAVAVDLYGNPMLFYKNETENPMVAHFDEETNNWGTVNSLGAVEADDLKLEVAGNGVTYASYTVGDQLYVHKYASPDEE